MEQEKAVTFFNSFGSIFIPLEINVKMCHFVTKPESVCKDRAMRLRGSVHVLFFYVFKHLWNHSKLNKVFEARHVVCMDTTN